MTTKPTGSQQSSDDDEGLYTIAVLPLSGTTVTATAVPSTTGLAVIDGTTISFRAQGITLPDGQVFSLGFNGLVDSSTTGTYRAVSILQTVKYDSTHHPTSAVTLTNGDESTWSVDVSPTETTTSSTGGSQFTMSTSLTSSGQQVSTLNSASTTGTETITGTTSMTSVVSTQTSAISTTTGGSGASSQHDVSNLGGLMVLLLSLLGLLRL